MKLLGRAGVACLVVVVAYLLIARLNQRSWLFTPEVYPQGHWNIQHIYGARDVQLTAPDGSRLSAWWVPAAPARRTVLFFHSRRGNISDQGERILRLQDLGANVFLLDYRGYGRSGGRPSVAGVYQDGETAYRYVTGTLRVSPRDLILQGDELGAAVAARLAAEHPQVAGLVLESPFPSLRALADAVMPLSGWVMSGHMDVTADVARYAGPKLFLFGSDDQVIPPSLSEQVYDAAAPPKFAHEIPGGGEGSLVVYSGDNYAEWMDDFYTQCHLASPAPAMPKSPVTRF